MWIDGVYFTEEESRELEKRRRKLGEERQREIDEQYRLERESISDRYLRSRYRGPKACPYREFQPCIEYQCAMFETFDAFRDIDESRPWRGHCTRQR